MFVTSFLWALTVRQEPLTPIYFVRNDSIYRFTAGKESIVVKNAVAPSLSPDQKQLAFIRQGNLYTFDLAKATTRKCSNLSEKPDDTPNHDIFPSWDSNSKHIVFSHPDRYSVSRRGENVSAMFGEERSNKTIWNVYWSWLSRPVGHSNLSLFLGNETSGSSTFAVNSSVSATFSPDGRKIAFCRNGDLWMASLDPASVHDGIKEASWDEARILANGILDGGTRAANETNMIFRISWSGDQKLLALSTDRYGAGGSAEVAIIKSDRPSEKVASFAGTDACFLDSTHVLYVKPYSQSQDIWIRDITTQEEKLLIAKGSEPAVLPRP